MTFVTVFRRVPKPIWGMTGTLYDPEFERFEANLDWLETTSVLVERFDPAAARDEVARRPIVRELLSGGAERILPLVLVNDREVSRAAFLNRTQLARVVGSARNLAVVQELARLGATAAIGSDDDVRQESARAHGLGLSQSDVREAVNTGLALKRRDGAAA